MRTSLKIIAAIFAGAILHAQLPQHTVTAVNLAANTVADIPTYDVDFHNDSDKDITAVTYKINVHYADGQTQPEQDGLFDLMMTIGLEHFLLAPAGPIGAIHAGKSSHVQQPIPRLRRDVQIAGVTIVPTAVAYLGGGAQGNGDHLKCIFDFRQSECGEVQIWAKAISGVDSGDQFKDMIARGKADHAP